MQNETLSALMLGAALSLASGSALAHAAITPTTAANNQTITAEITIPHGCDGAATTGITVTLPDGFVLAKPQPKPGWTLHIDTAAYPEPADDHGAPVTAGAHVIAWTGGNLPDDQFDTFAIRGSFQHITAETAARFIVLQTCGTAAVDWSEVPAPGQSPHALEHPAPTITVTAGAGTDHDMDMGAMSMGGMDHGAATADPGAPVAVGDIEITAAFTRATLPNAPVAGGYLTITNSGKTDDLLVAVASPAAGKAELHEMSMQGDVMKMAALPDGIAVPAGATVTLSPGGMHIMFMQLQHPFVKGETVPVTLTFEKAGTVTVQLPVAGIGADAPAMPGMKM